MQAGVERAVATTMSLLICALGRGLDFATTWVAIDRGRAVEAKPFAADVFQLFGHHSGMITYEALVTTPAIFLGCVLARRIFRAQPDGAANAARLIFFLIGIVSITVAMHNFRFLL